MAYTKDQRIINQNPDKTAYELLELGLSQEKYEQLVQDNYQPTGKIEQTISEPQSIEPIKPTIRFKDLQPKKSVKWKDMEGKVKPTVRAQPKTRDYVNPNAISTSTGDQAWLINKQTGNKLYMSRNQAERMRRKYPAKYDVR